MIDKVDSCVFSVKSGDPQGTQVNRENFGYIDIHMPWGTPQSHTVVLDKKSNKINNLGGLDGDRHTGQVSPLQVRRNLRGATRGTRRNGEESLRHLSQRRQAYSDLRA